MMVAVVTLTVASNFSGLNEVEKSMRIEVMSFTTVYT